MRYGVQGLPFWHTPCRRAEARTSTLREARTSTQFEHMAAFAAVATQEGRDANTPFPLLRMVGDYLTIDQLMPPCRLRWSHRLGRPAMESAHRTHGNDIVAFVYIEELHTYEALIEGRLLTDGDAHSVRQMSTLHRGHTRNQIWSVCIIDPDNEDTPYMEAWRLRYGLRWPLVDIWCLHPVLRRLLLTYEHFRDTVLYHGGDREREIMWARFPDARPAAAREE